MQLGKSLGKAVSKYKGTEKTEAADLAMHHYPAFKSDKLL